jgi:hypothetical protein
MAINQIRFESGGELAMVKRFFIRLLAAVVFLLLFSLRFVDATVGEKIWADPLESGWKGTGLVLEEVETETWMKLADRRMTVNELKNAAKKMQDTLGIRLKNNFITGKQDGYSYLSFTGSRADRTEVTVTLQSCRCVNRDETQLGIYTSKMYPADNLRPYLENLKTAINRLGKNGHTAVIFAGKCKGALNRDEARELSRKIFRKLDAELIEVARQSPENSVYKAYSADLPKNPESMIHSNIELMIGYDPASKVTRIRLATPGSEEGV